MLALQLLLRLASVATGAFGQIAAPGNATEQALIGLYAQYGAWALLGVAVVLVPIVEEFAFRGVVLNAMSRHVSFGAAAVIQALVFAACHDQWRALPYLFAVGLAAAWLYRRSRGLLAPIALHSACNLLVSIGILAH